MIAVGTWLMPLLGGDGLRTARHRLACAYRGLALHQCRSGQAWHWPSPVWCAPTRRPPRWARILNVLMAALGGIMVPLFVMPEVMQHIAAFAHELGPGILARRIPARRRCKRRDATTLRLHALFKR